MIGLVVVGAMPIIAMAATIAWQDYGAIARGAQERATLLDGQVLAAYSAAIDPLEASLRRIASNIRPGGCPSIGEGPEPSVSILALDVAGGQICRAGPAVGMPAAPWRWFEQVRGGASEAGGRFGADGSGVHAVRAPNGGVAAAVLPATWLDMRVLAAHLGEGDAIWLLDQDGSALASRGAAAAALPTAASMRRLLAASQVAIQAVTADGLRYAYATTLLPGGWRLIAATPAEREHQLAIHELLVRVAELAMLMMAGLAAVIMAADIAFGTPLRRLSAAVRRWQGGAQFDPGDLVGAPDEVLQLARSFHDATSGLRQRAMELEQAQERQDLLVLEVHHRVKNNLQVIASLLNLQASRIRVPEAKAEFQAARDRVRALATLHRHLYADGELHTINMRSFLTELCSQLFQAMGEAEGARIHMVIEAPELRMSGDQAVPLALIVTEAVTNSVRYAFPNGRTGEIAVMLRDHDGELDLTISDDGVGIPAGKADPDGAHRDGIGLQLIRGFSRQLGATLAIGEQGGTRYAVRLTRETLPRRGRSVSVPAEQEGAL